SPRPPASRNKGNPAPLRTHDSRLPCGPPPLSGVTPLPPHRRGSMRYLMLIPAALAIACGTDRSDDMQAGALLDTTTISAPGPVTAMLRDGDGRDIGLLTLSQADSGIRVVGRLMGFPQGSHALHIHTTGSCSPDFEAAGPHWNPTGKEHGVDNANGPHLGDLQDAEFQSDSSASYDAVAAGA